MDLYAFPGRLSTPAVVSANATLSIANQWVRFGAGSLSIGIPTPVGNAGRILILEKMVGGNGAITFTPAAGLIAGAATTAIHTTGETLSLISDGTDWIKTGRYIPSRRAGYKTTFSSGWGTVPPGNQIFESWRTGKCLNIVGWLTCGTVSANPAYFSIGFDAANNPANVLIDQTNYTVDGRNFGTWSKNGSAKSGQMVYINNQTLIGPSNDWAGGGMQPMTVANNFLVSGDQFSFFAYNIPIADWLD